MFWYFPPRPVFLIFHLHVSESPKTAAQLVVRTPWYTHHTDTVSAPLVARWRSNFLELHVCFNAVTSSTPACRSGLLQLYSPSWSLHSGPGIRFLPLPPCRCRTGGDCAFSRLGLLSGAHCHSTSGMQQPSKRSSWVSAVSLRPQIIWVA